jgi:tripartite-type tricarboxylate transporter receptor subunit TctC
MNHKFRSLLCALAEACLLLGNFRPLLAEDFYKDKTIRFIVGQAAGGGYDAYTRFIAQHIIKHIPGNPAVTVENMTGPGSLVAANYVYASARAGISSMPKATTGSSRF